MFKIDRENLLPYMQWVVEALEELSKSEEEIEEILGFYEGVIGILIEEIDLNGYEMARELVYAFEKGFTSEQWLGRIALAKEAEKAPLPTFEDDSEV